MDHKILLFIAWVVVGINAASFISLAVRFSPGLRLAVLLLVIAFFLISAIIAVFAPLVRPWILLIFGILLIGGTFVWLL